MKDKLSIAIPLICSLLILWGVYEVLTEVNNYDGGQGYYIAGTGILVLIIFAVLKLTDRPGR